jgi:peroxin-5
MVYLQLHQLPTGPHQAAANEQDLALARQFFEAKAQEHGFGPGFSLHAPDLARLEGRPDLQEAWAKEQSLRSMEGSTANAAWASEFQAAPQLNGSGPSMQSNPMAMQGAFLGRPTPSR